MAMLRFLLLAFNVAVVTFLIYTMLQILKQPMARSKKVLILTGGVILLLVPFGIFFKIFIPTSQYFVIYPVAIFFFLYLIKKL
jgi:hypothetical protein